MSVDLKQRPLVNQCSTCPHLKPIDFDYAVNWKVQGSEKSGMYVDEPHPCHERVELSCVGHCADLKLRKDKVSSSLNVPQDNPFEETCPSWQTLMDSWKDHIEESN